MIKNFAAGNLVLLFVCLPLPAQISNAKNALVCPAEVPAGSNSQPSRRAQFERISVFNRDKDGREYDLAPDNETHQGRRVTQTWNLNDYREMPLFLTCRYKNTDKVVSVELPPALSRCTQTFELDAHANITGKSIMSCR